MHNRNEPRIHTYTHTYTHTRTHTHTTKSQHLPNSDPATASPCQPHYRQSDKYKQKHIPEALNPIVEHLKYPNIQKIAYHVVRSARCGTVRAGGNGAAWCGRLWTPTTQVEMKSSSQHCTALHRTALHWLHRSLAHLIRLARPNESRLFGPASSCETNIERALLEQSNNRFAAAARRRRNGNEHL